MNYYRHHIGDYLVETSHLTFLEDAAYSRLIRLYFHREAAFPADVATVQRLSGARSKAEKTAVAVVLNEFFTLIDDGWHHATLDKELAAYKINKETLQENGKKGGRPKSRPEPRDNPNETSEEPDTNQDETKAKPSNNQTLTKSKANQEPITKNQEPKNNTHTPFQLGDETQGETVSETPMKRGETQGETLAACVDPKNLGENLEKSPVAEPEKPPPGVDCGESLPTGKLAKLLRQLGVQVTPHNPDFRQWVENGLDAEELTAAVEIARSAKPKPEPIPWGYLAKVMLSQRKAKSGHIPARQRDANPWDGMI